jgi:hypothetical protein
MYLYVSEIFPTEIRPIGMGFSLFGQFAGKSTLGRWLLCVAHLTNNSHDYSSSDCPYWLQQRGLEILSGCHLLVCLLPAR